MAGFTIHNSFNEVSIMNYTITLSLHAGTWMATYSNPKIIEAFGCDTIPTAYTVASDAKTVGKRLQAANPDCVILFDFIPNYT